MTTLYIDSAVVADWRAALACALIQRATCNPLLMREAGLAIDMENVTALHREACALGLAQIHLQAWPDEAGRWEPVAEQITALSDRVVVKLPALPKAMACAAQLKRQGKRVLVTAVSNPLHGLWAFDIGADFVAPYVGRLNEAGRDGHALVDELVALQERGGPQVLAASVRGLAMLGRLIRQGVAAVTLRKTLLDSATQDEATLLAVEQFEAARKRA